MAITKVTRTCENCGEGFQVPPYVIRRTDRRGGRFCSQPCFDEFRKANWKDRFWSKVAIAGDDECWLWVGNPSRSGYGQFSATVNGVRKTIGAHKFAYQSVNGPVPEGLILRHKCDTRACCNLNHIELGTHKDNARDRDTRGRANPAVGTQYKSAKLNDNAVRQIRRRYVRGVITMQSLADEYGVDGETVRHVLLGDTWKHVY